MRSIKTLIAALALTGLALNGQASPGGLDQYGGHTEKATGQYHFHQLNGKKLAEPLPGMDPDKNGAKISYTGTPKYTGEAASEQKAPAEKAEKKELKEEKAPAKEEKAEKVEKKAKKSKKAKKEKAEVAEPKAKKEKAEAKDAKDEKPAKKSKKAKKAKKAKADKDDKK